MKEINTKIKAEVIDFLSDMTKLTQLDFQFIDFNKKRIEIIYAIDEESNKQNGNNNRFELINGP
ncbi:hypothetical protein [Paenibacillus sp.]|uniref:hypothetical protein n=1 Tax=Paenibacillus sp. TaxID=58172 RepID=UPI0028B15517|nr:hypothetical protein [Paenibacillus sp.]